MAHSQAAAATAETPNSKRTNSNGHAPDAEAQEDAGTGSLTFVTTDGERITFSDLAIPPADEACLAGEEALAKIWDRPAEDRAWDAALMNPANHLS